MSRNAVREDCEVRDVDLKALLQRRKVIPAVKRITDLPVVFATSKAAVIILLGGSINELDEIKRASQKYPDKVFLMHIDLLNGVGKDAEGIRFLKQVGFHGIVSVKSQLLHVAQEFEMLTVQRLFLLDSESVKSGEKLLKKISPDAIEILPAVVPKFVIQEYAKITEQPLLGGGLLRTEEDVKIALDKGFDGVTVSRQNLWNLD